MRKKKTTRQSVKGCKKMNTRNCKNSSSKKITGFDESKSSSELDSNGDSCTHK